MGIFNFNTIDFKNLKDIDLISIITRFMINIPFLWIATVANINLNKYTKLEQEYSHKESLAKSFERYKKYLEKYTAEELNIFKIIYEFDIKDRIHQDIFVDEMIKKLEESQTQTE